VKLTIDEAAKHYRRSRRTIERWLDDFKLTFTTDPAGKRYITGERRIPITEDELTMYEHFKNNCKGDCISNPEYCECFGIHSKETRKYLGETLEEAEKDAFYKKEDCAHYDTMAYYFLKGGK